MSTADQTDLAIASPAVEERRLDQERELRFAEIALREREIEAKEAELERSRWANPTTIGLFVAALGLIGNLVVTLVNNHSAQTLAHSQAQSTLIVQAVSTGNPDSACKNLLSFIGLGLLDDPHGTLGQCAKKPSSIPVLPNTTSYVPQYDSTMGFNVHIKRADDQDKVHFDVSFTVPPTSSDITGYDNIQVYAFKENNKNHRSDDIPLPDVHGKWNPGDTASFSVELDSSFVNDKTLAPHLHFCIGMTHGGCWPSENLLEPSAK
jgi:hypothetical protein